MARPMPGEIRVRCAAACSETGATRSAMRSPHLDERYRASLGYLGALLKASLVPFSRGEDVSQDLRGAQDLGMAIVERSETEAHEVGRAEVADHSAGNQRLHHGIALRMSEDDVAAPQERVAG